MIRLMRPVFMLSLNSQNVVPLKSMPGEHVSYVPSGVAAMPGA
jgi:hypothetical protein